jgi:transcription initiation factor TFIIH subunit 3
MHQSEALLALPRQGGADFRGACFCHGKVIDLGFVCSVCLSGKPANRDNFTNFISTF